jgi:hypothetical protein
MPKPCEAFARALAHRIIEDSLSVNAPLANNPGAYTPSAFRDNPASRFEGILSPLDAVTLLREAEEKEEDSL